MLVLLYEQRRLFLCAHRWHVSYCIFSILPNYFLFTQWGPTLVPVGFSMPRQRFFGIRTRTYPYLCSELGILLPSVCQASGNQDFPPVRHCSRVRPGLADTAVIIHSPTAAAHCQHTELVCEQLPGIQHVLVGILGSQSCSSLGSVE